MINKSIKYSPKRKALGFLGKSSCFVLCVFFPILKPEKQSLFLCRGTHSSPHTMEQKSRCILPCMGHNSAARPHLVTHLLSLQAKLWAAG